MLSQIDGLAAYVIKDMWGVDVMEYADVEIFLASIAKFVESSLPSWVTAAQPKLFMGFKSFVI